MLFLICLKSPMSSTSKYSSN